MNTSETIIELIEAAIDTGMPEMLLTVFSEKVLNENSRELRDKANNIIAKELKLQPVTDLKTSEEMMGKLSKVDKKAFFKLLRNYLKRD